MVTRLLWLPASVGPRDMGMVLQHKLPEVTSRGVLNAIRLPGYSGYQHLWVLGTWVWCPNTSYLRLPQELSTVTRLLWLPVLIRGMPSYAPTCYLPRVHEGVTDLIPSC